MLMKKKLIIIQIFILIFFISFCSEKENQVNNQKEKKVNTEKKRDKIFDNFSYIKGLSALPKDSKTIISFSAKSLFSDEKNILSYKAKEWKDKLDAIGVDITSDIDTVIAASPFSIVESTNNFIAYAYGNFNGLDKKITKLVRDTDSDERIQKKAVLEKIDGIFTYTNPLEGISIGFVNRNIIFACTHFRIKETISLLKGEATENLSDNKELSDNIEKLSKYKSFYLISDVKDKSKELLKGFSYADDKYKTMQQILGNIEYLQIATNHNEGLSAFISIKLSTSDMALDFTDRINTQIWLLSPSSPLTKKIVPYLKFKAKNNEALCEFKIDKKQWEEIKTDITK